MKLLKPSFFALIFSGLTIGIALILLYINYKNQVNATSILLLSIAIAAHGMLHFLYEHYYGFNPLVRV